MAAISAREPLERLPSAREPAGTWPNFLPPLDPERLLYLVAEENPNEAFGARGLTGGPEKEGAERRLDEARSRLDSSLSWQPLI